ncbi:MAG: N-acetylmuramoyl-L-alanine amidase-like domain-containing protein [Mariniphaga sp.]
MKIRLLYTVFCVLSSWLVAFAAPETKIVVTEIDKAILHQKFDQFSKDQHLSTGALMLKIGLDFKGTSYIGKTLDRTPEENLVINLHELDCTTFVENCLAIARTIKNGQPDFEKFAAELQKIRYRNGVLNGYASRLHYFSEWITDNAAKGIVEDMTAKVGGINCPVSVSFMSTHPEYYPQLKANSALINVIRQIENRISAKQYFFIPKEKIAAHEREMEDGDIIALVTRISGMDVSHIGLAVKKQGRVFLLNASSKGAKVETTQVLLADYLKDSKNTTGIFVVRAK